MRSEVTGKKREMELTALADGEFQRWWQASAALEKPF
jgi:hypothetical protein